MQKLKIISVKSQGKKKTYNLHVRGEMHNFILDNGLISGNSHSCAYALIGYQTAYLKHHYPSHFLCACLISDSDETEKIIKYISYCKEVDIKVLPPDINLSQADFSLEDRAIRFGLGAIKNLGKGPVTHILQERSKGNFVDLLDFAARIDPGVINRKKMESLILSGAFEFSGQDRASLLGTIDCVLDHKDAHKRYLVKLETYQRKQAAYLTREDEIKNGSKKKSFKIPQAPEKPSTPTNRESDPLTPLQQLAYEHELLGYFLSGHPLDYYQNVEATTIQEAKELEHDSQCVVAAVPVLLKEVTTRKKTRMAHVVIEDKTGTLTLVIFPATYKKIGSLISIGIPFLWKISIDKTEENALARGRTISITKMDVESSPATSRRLELQCTSQQVPLLIKRLKSTGEPITYLLHIDGNYSRSTLSWRAPGNYKFLKQELREFCK